MGMPIPNSAILGGSAATELAAVLKKAVKDYDEGVAPDQQSKAFLSKLKALGDSLDHADTDINEYQKTFDRAANTHQSPNNPTPPPADKNLTQGQVPSGQNGTSNPFFNNNPQATLFQEILSILSLQGFIAKSQVETGIENMKTMMTEGKDLAMSQIQEANVTAASLNKQASMDEVQAGISFGTAAGTLVAGLSEAGEHADELDNLDKDIASTENKISNVSKINKNNDELESIDTAQKGIKSQTDQIDEKLTKKTEVTEENDIAVQQEASNKKKAADKVQKEGDLKVEAQKDESFQVEDTRSEKEIQDNLDQIRSDKNDLDQKIKSKESDKTQLEKEIKDSETNRDNNLTKGTKEYEAEENKINNLKTQHTQLKSQIANHKAEQQVLQTQEAHESLQLMKKSSKTPPYTAKQIEGAKTAYKNNVANSKAAIDDLIAKNPEDAAELLSQKDKLLQDETEFYKQQPDTSQKLSDLKNVLTQRKQVLEQRTTAIEAKNKTLTDDFEKMTAQDADAAENMELLKDDPKQLEKKLNKSLAESKAKRRQIAMQKANPEMNWKFQVFKGMMTGFSQMVSGMQKNIEAQGQLNAAIWKSRQTLDQNYMQIMSQSMQSMLEASKGSISQGDQWAQGLMGISDKGTAVVHWSI